MRVWMLALACAVGCTRKADPYGEAVVIVDTDVQIPRLAGRLRLDVYSADHARWIESRDVELIEPKDWPASFSLYNRKDTGPETVIVRLRAYPQGITREYHGERYTPRSPSTPAGDAPPIGKATAGEGPRLFDAAGVDITPREEPSPPVTIDRLLVVRLEPGVRGSVRTVLHGECLGTMAKLDETRSCIDTENTLVQASEAALDPDLQVHDPVPRTFGARTACELPLRAPTPGLFDDEVCIPGGGFLLGSPDGFGEGVFSSSPQRVAVLPPFRMDKFEVTVGRWRAAVIGGFVSPDDSPQENDSPLGLVDIAACTYSSVPMGREDYPLSCVSVPAARAFCELFGGDLPSEAEWMWVAQDAERDRKTIYPWGDDPPTCTRAVYARMPGNSGMFYDACVPAGRGPRPESETAGDGGDLAIGTNVANLAGSMSEIVGDAFHGFGQRCWASAGIHSPECVDDAAPDVTNKGAAWDDNVVTMASKSRRSFRRDPNHGAPELGFRCVRRGG